MDQYNNQQSNNFSNSAPKKEYNLAEEKELIAQATEQLKQELQEKWQQTYASAQIFPATLSALSPQAQKTILSFGTTLLYNSIAKDFSFSQSQRDLLPRIVWQAVLQNSFPQVESTLVQHLQISPSIAKQVVAILNQKIFSVVKNISIQNFSPSQIDQVQENKIEKLTLSDVLKSIPEIGEQLITNEKISVKGFPEPVRPSIKNWLADYYLNLGNEKHNSMQRGAYLFRNKNGLTLSDLDRQRLDFILRASDEKSMLEIDVTAKKIIFPKFEKATPSKTIPPVKPKNPLGRSIGSQNFSSNYSAPTFDFSRGDMQINQHLHEKTIPNIQKESYSSPQKMSFEKKPALAQNSAPAHQQPTPLQNSLTNIQKSIPSSIKNTARPIQKTTPAPPRKERSFSDMLSSQKNKSAHSQDINPIKTFDPNQPTAPASKSKLSFSEELKKMHAEKEASHNQPKNNLINVINLKDVV